MGALACTHRNHEYKTQSRQELQQAKISTKSQGEGSHSPQGSGATVGYHKKGHPKQEPKRLPKPCKYQSQRTTTRSRLILRFARGPRRKGLGRKANSPPRRGPLAEALSPEAPPRKASDGLPILRFARGPTHKASGEVPILRLARGRLGNNLVASVSTDFSDKTSRVQPLPQRQPHVDAIQRSDRRDGR